VSETGGYVRRFTAKGNCEIKFISAMATLTLVNRNYGNNGRLDKIDQT